MLRPKWQQWLFGKNGGLISPEVKSPWGILVLGTTIGILVWYVVRAILGVL